MVVNTVMTIGRKRPVVSASTSGRPKPSAVNISLANARQHEAMMEARHIANEASANLKSAMDALAIANAENGMLRRRIEELESENARLLEFQVAHMSASKASKDQSNGKEGKGRHRRNKDALPSVEGSGM